MRRKWYIAIACAVAVALVALVLRIITSETDNTENVATTDVAFTGLSVEYSGDNVCEVLVELGSVYRSSTISKSVRIINCSATPLVLVDYSTQCRCMWLEIDRTPIAQGDYKDIELIFDSRGEWGSVGNYMEITTSTEGAPIVLWIAAEIE